MLHSSLLFHNCGRSVTYSSSSAAITGTVVDSASNPVKGAEVRLIGAEAATHTDSLGKFQLQSSAVALKGKPLENASGVLDLSLHLEASYLNLKTKSNLTVTLFTLNGKKLASTLVRKDFTARIKLSDWNGVLIIHAVSNHKNQQITAKLLPGHRLLRLRGEPTSQATRHTDQSNADNHDTGLSKNSATAALDTLVISSNGYLNHEITLTSYDIDCGLIQLENGYQYSDSELTRLAQVIDSLSKHLDSVDITLFGKSAGQIFDDPICMALGIDTIYSSEHSIGVRFKNGGTFTWYRRYHAIDSLLSDSAVAALSKSLAKTAAAPDDVRPRALIVTGPDLPLGDKEAVERLDSGLRTHYNVTRVRPGGFHREFVRSGMCGYDLLFFDTHGIRMNERTWMVTGEPYDPKIFSHGNNLSDWVNDRISGENPVGNSKYFMISDDYIRKYDSDGCFDGAIVYLASCHSMDQEKELAAAFHEKGARIVIGWTGDAFTSAFGARPLLDYMIKRCMTVSDAYASLGKKQSPFLESIPLCVDNAGQYADKCSPSNRTMDKNPLEDCIDAKGRFVECSSPLKERNARMVVSSQSDETGTIFVDCTPVKPTEEYIGSYKFINGTGYVGNGSGLSPDMIAEILNKTGKDYSDKYFVGSVSDVFHIAWDNQKTPTSPQTTSVSAQIGQSSSFDIESFTFTDPRNYRIGPMQVRCVAFNDLVFAGTFDAAKIESYESLVIKVGTGWMGPHTNYGDTRVVTRIATEIEFELGTLKMEPADFQKTWNFPLTSMTPPESFTFEHIGSGSKSKLHDMLVANTQNEMKNQIIFESLEITVTLYGVRYR